MIAKVDITALGNEGNVVYAHPASGLEIIDVILNGDSIDYWQDIIDNTYGKVTLSTALVRGDWVSVIYKTLPSNTVSMVDFSESDFESADFA